MFYLEINFLSLMHYNCHQFMKLPLFFQTNLCKIIRDLNKLIRFSQFTNHMFIITVLEWSHRWMLCYSTGWKTKPRSINWRSCKCWVKVTLCCGVAGVEHAHFDSLKTKILVSSFSSDQILGLRHWITLLCHISRIFHLTLQMTQFINWDKNFLYRLFSETLISISYKDHVITSIM